MDSKQVYNERIVDYCRNNVGEKVLATVFNMLWPIDGERINPRDLAFLTSKIIYDLSRQGILREVRKPKELDFIPHGMYEILDFR